MRLKAVGSATFAKSQTYAPVKRIQPFQGDIHHLHVSDAVQDSQNAADLQFHLEHKKLFLE